MLISILFACTAPTTEFDLSADQLAGLDESEVHPSRVLVFDEDGSYETIESHDPIAAVWDYRDRGVYAEPDLVRSISTISGGGDPLADYQWHFDLIGVDANSSEHKGFGATVAVVDTGVSLGGEDTPVFMAAGFDFTQDIPSAEDDNGHGTHVAGTIAQATGNGFGVGGIAPDATILPVRVLDADGSGYASDVASGIVWAVDNGADVINLSLGSSSPSRAERRAIRYAVEHGVLVVAASGNDGGATGYPARYPEAVAVSAVGADGRVTSYSNVGGIELAAPGGDTSVDRNGDGYGDGVLQETFVGGEWGYWFYQGTSMAAPHVAGAAALLVGAGATPEEARDLLADSAVDTGRPGKDGRTGYGLIDAAAALEMVAGQNDVSDPEETDPDVDSPDEEPGEFLIDLVGEMGDDMRRVSFRVPVGYEVDALVCTDDACVQNLSGNAIDTGWFESRGEAYEITLSMDGVDGPQNWGPYAF